MTDFQFKNFRSLVKIGVPYAWFLGLLVNVISIETKAQEEPPPPPPTTEYGSLIIRQNDELNQTTSITMFRGPGGTLNWEPVWLDSSRGDFTLAFFQQNDFEAGTMIATVAENGRDNRPFGDANRGTGLFRGSVSIAATPTAGQPTTYRIATGGAWAPLAGGENGGEVNINTSFVYFPYNLWLAGNAWVFSRSNGARVDRLTGTPGLELGVHLTNPANGRYELDLRGLDATATAANGILLANHAKDEDNYASTVANADGTFTLRIKDNGSSGAGLEQDPVTFVYIPTSKVGSENLLAVGRVRNNGTSSVRAGNYSVAHVGTGTWHLTIPGNSPTTGTLLITPCGAGNMEDNLISYQWNDAGYWVVQAADVVSATTLPVLENGITPWEEIFSFAFFGAPQLPQVTLTSPTQGQQFNEGSDITVAADAFDTNGTVERVLFFRNNRLIAELTEPPYQITDSNLEGGHYIYQARAIDNDGLAPSSTPVSVRVTFDPLNPPTNTALAMDGLTEHVRTLVVEPSLGLGGPPNQGFTLECWFRKDGSGATASSGVGGILVHPLMAKGRGESDNNNTDTNYLFGVTLDGLLAADFEAFPTPGVTGGANFPVFGTHDPIVDGRWYHAAVSYNGVTGRWRLFLNGVQVGERETLPGVLPRYDSNHRFAVGAAMNTLNQRAGSFFGVIDEVRVWDYVRTGEEILSTKDATVVQAQGLLARFGMDERTGVVVTSHNGIVANAFGPTVVDDEEGGTVSWVPLWVEGAPLTNQAPLVEVVKPLADAIVLGTTPILLEATASDVDGQVDVVRFFDGSTLLAEVSSAPYRFVWSGALPGTRKLRAVAVDNLGAVTVDEITLTVAAAPTLLLTEVQSAQSGGAPVGVGDYWELTNFGSQAVSLAGYTWHDSARNRQAALGWSLPAGTSIAAGESIVFTGGDPAILRQWWGLPASVRVIQSVGAPGLGQNDGVALYNGVGAEVFFFSWAPGGFTRGNGSASTGGHAGSAGGGRDFDALVWDPNSGIAYPRYTAAGDGVNGGFAASQGSDVGSPGGSGGAGVDPANLLLVEVAPGVFSENAGNAAAVGTVERLGNLTNEMVVFLVSSKPGRVTVPETVTIAAGEASATFAVAAVDNILADGDETVMLAATAGGASLAAVNVMVTDDGDLPPATLLVTEVQSNQSGAAGSADYFEITNYGAAAVDLTGFTWDDDSRSFVTGQAWAFPLGSSIAAGESVVVTSADPAAFRAWWGLDGAVQVIQTVGAPGLGQSDGVALFDNNGRELVYLDYSVNGFLREDGSAALGGHAGASGGGTATDALVWVPTSGVAQPRFTAAVAGNYGAFQAVNGATDVGSPGTSASELARPFTLQLLHLSDAQGSELAIQTAPMLAALAEAFEMDESNSLMLAGGDMFIAGAFLYAGADEALNAVSAIGETALGRPDVAIHNLIGVDAAVVGAREWDLGSAMFMNALAAEGSWSGAAFPLLAVNLDYTGDAAAQARFTDVPLDGVVTAVPTADTLQGRLAPVTVVERGGQKIGVVAATSQRLADLTSPTGTRVMGAESDDLDILAGQIQGYVDELVDEGVNKIVVLTHLRDLALERALAGRLRGVDILVAGGAQQRMGDSDDVAVAFAGHEASFEEVYPVMTEDQLGEPMLLVSTDSEYTYLGRLLVDFDAQGRIIESSVPSYLARSGAYAATLANVAAAWGVAEVDVEATAFAVGRRGAAVREVTTAIETVLNAKDSVIHGFTAEYAMGEREVTGLEETNLGNLVADANLGMLRNAVGNSGVPMVSLHSAGGLTGSLGAVVEAADGSAAKRPPTGYAPSGKGFGAVSQLDVEHALRRNRGMMSFETTPAGLKALLEHGLSGLPNGGGRFPQVGGVAVAFDPQRAVGDRVTSISLVNEDGSFGAPIFKAGPLGVALLERAPQVIRVVMPNELANGGEGYPSKVHGDNFRYVLADGTLGPVIANKSSDFTVAPQRPVNAETEQGALGGWLASRFATAGLAFRQADRGRALDERLQNVAFRADLVPPFAGLDSDGDGLSDLDEVAFGGDPLAAMRVGDRVDLDLSLWMTGGRTLRLIGRLPAGLRFDPATGRLSGIITGAADLYDLQLQVLEAGRVVDVVALPLAPQGFPTRLLAGYEALLETPTGQPNGLAQLTISKAGSWSGAVQLAGQGRRTARGVFELIPGEPRARVEMVFKGTRVLPELKLEFLVDADSALVEGDYEQVGVPTGGGVLRGLRLAGVGGAPLATQRLNLAWDAGEQDGVAYPAGIGWAKGTVLKTGGMTVRGQLGDGQAVVISSQLGVNGQALMWAQPYRNKGSYVGGVMDLPDFGQATPVAQSLVTGLEWFKAADVREKAYAAGFVGPLQLTTLSGLVIPQRTAADLSAVLGLTDNLFEVEIEGGGLSNEVGSLPELMNQLSLAPNFTLISNQTTAAPWRGAVSRADGGVTGTLTLPLGVGNLAGRAAVSGVLLPQGAADGVVGAGLVRVPVAGGRGAFQTSALILRR